jgi:diadenosine tetraphosphate (Ap4A) HIT family hydrolase
MLDGVNGYDYIDILPLRAGHTLVIAKAHIPKLSELPAELAAAMGKVVSKVARALTEGNPCANEQRTDC